MVRPATTVSIAGRSIPRDLKTAISPPVSAKPTAIPIPEATSPTANASSTTEPSTWRREAPTVRNIANSRAR